MSDKSKQHKKNSGVRAAILFGSGTLTSRILGLIRDSLIASMMPVDMKDAWLAAFRVPNFFRRLLGEGGLSVSFIPVLVESQELKNPVQHRELLNGVFTSLMSLVLLICVFCFIFMDTIIFSWLTGPGFTLVPGKLEMTVVMAKIMVFFLFFICLFAYFMAVLNSLKKFTLSGYAPLFLNIPIIIALLFYSSEENLIVASAVAVVVGGFLQAFVLLPAIVRAGYLPRLQLAWHNPLIHKVFKKFIPTLFGVGILQIYAVINAYFASYLPIGSVTYIYLADRLLELPLSLIAVSLGTTLLPSLSEYWSQRESQKFVASFLDHLKFFYFLAIPAAFGLWFLGFDIIHILYKRGEFTSPETLVVYKVLQVYCLTLLAAGFLKIVNQAFYSTGDTLTPACISAGGLMIHLFMAPILMDLLGIRGLVLSTALITSLNLVISFFVLQRKTMAIALGELRGHFLKCLGASLVMAGYLFLVQKISWRQGRLLLDLPLLLMIIVIAAGVFFFVASKLGVLEAKVLLTRLGLARK